jgi:pimeloyl-ACP methyl ester carboxylesterase
MWLGTPGGLIKSGCCVITPDNRGTGLSDAPLPPYTMATLADDLAEVVRHAACGPALVVGISLGGMISQHLALRNPDLVRGLVLAATSCGIPHGAPPGPSFLVPMLRSFTGDQRAIRRVRQLLVHPDSLVRNPRLFQAWDHEMQRAPVRWQGIAGQLSAAALHSTGFCLGRIRVPTVVIAGRDDRIIPPHNSEILAQRIPGSELVLLEGAGHAFPLERPDALPRAIRAVCLG